MSYAMLNGRIVPLNEASVSVLDRSFLYGDGLFETLRVCHGQPFRWNQHIERMTAGAEVLGIRLAFTAEEMRAQAAVLIEQNMAGDSVLRIHLSRGLGVRGYSPRGADAPLLVMTSHPRPPLSPGQMAAWKVVSSPWRMPEGDALGKWKTANKLLNILARKAADDAGADEALILNSRGEACEASGANLFWIEGDQLLTPPVETGILAGVTRGVILELAKQSDRDVVEAACPLSRLRRADAVFLSQSALGVIRVCGLEGQPVGGNTQVAQWCSAYQHVLETETRCSP